MTLVLFTAPIGGFITPPPNRMASRDPKGASNPVPGPEPIPIPLDIGDRRNEVRVDSGAELTRGERESELLLPLAIRYGMNPPKLPA
jgi:hypothetical protein